MNRDSLYYLEQLNAYEIMETHIMDRVMLEYWAGDLDAGGNFFDTSTSYSILANFDQSFDHEDDYDCEYVNRFYRSKDTDRSNLEAHQFTF